MLACADFSFMVFVIEMTAKFNQEMYARLRARKNEPQSNISQKRPKVTKEVFETTASTSVASEPKAASLIVFINEITPCPKRMRGNDKGKSKADSSVKDDAATALGRAHNVITLDELKSLSTIPSHELVNYHIQKRYSLV